MAEEESNEGCYIMHHNTTTGEERCATTPDVYSFLAAAAFLAAGALALVEAFLVGFLAAGALAFFSPEVAFFEAFLVGFLAAGLVLFLAAGALALVEALVEALAAAGAFAEGFFLGVVAAFLGLASPSAGAASLVVFLAAGFFLGAGFFFSAARPVAFLGAAAFLVWWLGATNKLEGFEKKCETRDSCGPTKF